MNTVMLLLSGGLDSVTLLHHFHHTDQPVYACLFSYGQRHVQELVFAKQHCHQLNVSHVTAELPPLRGSKLTDSGGNWVVPARNSVMLSVACNLAEAMGFSRVAFGANRDDAEQFPDCRKRFVDAFNEMLFHSGLKVRVEAPFLKWNKAKIARLASDMGIKPSQIWTCYEGGKKPCGACPACLKLAAALA
jgi:7-cyano-7-deazaguanine synthase